DGRGHVVVRGRDDRVDAPGLPVRDLEAFERLRARHFVDEVAVDVDERGAVRFLVDDVGGPELFVEGAGHGDDGLQTAIIAIAMPCSPTPRTGSRRGNLGFARSSHPMDERKEHPMTLAALVVLTLVLLAAAGYAQWRIPRFEATRSGVMLTRGLLVLVGVGFGFVSTRYYASATYPA